MSKEEIEDRGDIFVPEVEDDDEELELLDDDEDIEDEESDDESEDVSEDDDDDSEDDDDDSEDGSEDGSEDDDEEDEDDDEDDEDESEQRIPKGRLNQVLRQRDEERERVRWLEEQLEVLIRGKGVEDEDDVEEEDAGPPEYDFDEAEAKYIELILEGEVKDATALRKEINKARDELYNYQIDTARKAAKNDAVTETSNSLDEARFNTLLTGYVEEFDFLNDKSKAYNEKAVVMANKLMASYMAEGKTKSQALKAAVEDVTPLFEKPKAKPSATERTKEARKKAARASKTQPPSLKGTGKASRTIKPSDIGKMSEKIYNSLTAKEKAKLRGDIL